MRKSERHISIPKGAQWATLAGGSLSGSSDLAEWLRMVDRFDPEPHGHEMRDWLRACIEAKTMRAETHLLCDTEQLFGFLAVSEVHVRISWRDRPIFEVHKQKVGNELESGLMLSHIVRDRSTESGFGRVLFNRAVGIALSRPPIVAVFVQPDDDKVAEMWRRDYYLREMDKPEIPGLLYFPVGTKPPQDGPS